MQFNYSLTALALLVIYTLVASAQCMQVMNHVQRSSLGPRVGWIWISAMGVGCSFVVVQLMTQLALRPNAQISFNGEIAMLVGLPACIGVALTISLTGMKKTRLYLGACGGLLGTVMVGCHVFGLAALNIDAPITWNRYVFLLASGLGIGFMAAALACAGDKPRKDLRPFLPVVLFACALLAQNIIGHSALIVTPASIPVDVHADPSVSTMVTAVLLAGTMLLVSGFAVHLIDVSLREESDAQLRHMALHDPLTALPNRTAFRKRLKSELEQRNEDDPIAVIGIDLNRFKEINDTWGHSAGDSVLQEVSQRLHALGNDKFSARFGGDEFAILTRFSSEIELQSFAESLQAMLTQPINLDIGEVAVGASLGVAVHPRDGKDENALILNADLAMYKAKIDPVENVYFYDDHLGEQVRVQRALINDLAEAIENDQLEVHYQIQTDAQTDETVGYEALLRWTHPTLGPISPSVFIPLAEANGLIVKLGNWVLEQACREAIAWTKPVKVAVNLSAVQLSNGNIVNRVHEVLLETGLTPTRLEIELTETAVIRDRHQALRMMRQLKNLGVKIALDDFGAGYSSLDILRTFPFDRIKLDKSFVQSMNADEPTRAVVEAVLGLAHSLSIPVLAEGIENKAQLDQIRETSFDQVQGYFLGKPALLDPETMTQPGVEIEGEWRTQAKSA